MVDSSILNKSSKFSTLDLAQYITKKYKDEYDNENMLKEDELIRSLLSCKRDLVRWGFYLGKLNSLTLYKIILLKLDSKKVKNLIGNITKART